MARDSVRPSRQLSDSECDFIPTDESEDDLEAFNEEVWSDFVQMKLS